MTIDFDGYINLTFWMCLRAQLADAAIEQLGPTHLEEGGDGFVFFAWHITYTIRSFVAWLSVHDGYCIRVVTVFFVML